MLLWLFLTPFVAALLLFVSAFLTKASMRCFSICVSLIPLLLLILGFPWKNSEIALAWFPSISIEFLLRIDNLALIFLFLTNIIVPIALLMVSRQDGTTPIYACILLLQGLLIGFFTARDLVFFTIFWEAMLIPIYFIISSRGGASQAAAMKFLIYTIAGSSLMVIAVLALFLTSINAQSQGTFDMDLIAKTALSAPYGKWICAIFLLAFAVKTPLFPFHAWLPDAYTLAPTAGTILLSALLSKAGIYGLVRIGWGFFPVYLQAWSPFLLGLAIIGVLYGALAAWRQNDFKRLIAYSSFSHVNFILAGLLISSSIGHAGAILQAFNHGITITALFLVVAWLEARLGTTQMNQTSGVAKYWPRLCWLTLFFILSSVALPGTNNFIGEFFILLGLFAIHPWATFWISLTIILSVVYMLRWMQKVYFRQNTLSHEKGLEKDIKGREMAIAFPLVFLILWIGLYPLPVLQKIEPAVKVNLVEGKQENFS